jgi:hypothetical protein
VSRAAGSGAAVGRGGLPTKGKSAVRKVAIRGGRCARRVGCADATEEIRMTAHPKSWHDVLIVTGGMTPQVVTETVYELARRVPDRFVPAKIVCVVTGGALGGFGGRSRRRWSGFGASSGSRPTGDPGQHARKRATAGFMSRCRTTAAVG